jgi:hypothetical protein
MSCKLNEKAQFAFINFYHAEHIYRTWLLNRLLLLSRRWINLNGDDGLKGKLFLVLLKFESIKSYVLVGFKLGLPDLGICRLFNDREVYISYESNQLRSLLAILKLANYQHIHLLYSTYEAPSRRHFRHTSKVCRVIRGNFNYFPIITQHKR